MDTWLHTSSLLQGGFLVALRCRSAPSLRGESAQTQVDPRHDSCETDRPLQGPSLRDLSTESDSSRGLASPPHSSNDRVDRLRQAASLGTSPALARGIRVVRTVLS